MDGRVLFSSLFLISFLSCAWGYSERDTTVPVFIWSNLRLPEKIASSSYSIVKSISREEALPIFQSVQQNHDVTLVFIEPELAPSTFVSHSASFKYLKEWMTSGNFHYLRRVEEPVQAIEGATPKQMGQNKVIRVRSDEGVPRDLTPGTLVLVTLSALSEETKGDGLRQHDHRIKEFIDIVSKKWSYLAFYTSRTVNNDVVVQRTRRAVEGDAEATADNTTAVVSHRDANGMYFVESITLAARARSDGGASHCNSPKVVVIAGPDTRLLNITCDFPAVIAASDPVGEVSISFLWTLNNATETWWLLEAGATRDGTLYPITFYELAQTSQAAYTKASYYCSDMSYYLKMGDLGTTYINLGVMQVEPFREANETTRFSDMDGLVFDCAPFFSIEAFTVLFVVLILIMITLFGVCMLSTLSTFDQFDDPKGKTIQVNIGGSD